MTPSILMLALWLAAQPAAQGQIIASGRDYAGLSDSAQIFRGSCDGREVSIRIEERGPVGEPGRIVLNAGAVSVVAPSEFQNGALAGSAIYRGETACDGQRLGFRAIVIRQDGTGRLLMRDQSLFLDMETGRLRMTEPRLLNADEIRFHLQHGGDNPTPLPGSPGE